MALATNYKAFLFIGEMKMDLFPVASTLTDAQNYIDTYQGYYEYGVVETVYTPAPAGTTTTTTTTTPVQ